MKKCFKSLFNKKPNMEYKEMSEIIPSNVELEYKKEIKYLNDVLEQYRVKVTEQTIQINILRREMLALETMIRNQNYNSTTNTNTPPILCYCQDPMCTGIQHRQY